MATTVTVSRNIAASPESVWTLVTDLPRMGEWSPENQGGRWVGDATGPAIGAVFAGKNRNGWRRWGTRVTVVECEAPRRFVFRLRIGRLGWCDWGYDIEATGDGCCVTESWVDGRSWLLSKVGLLVSGVGDRATHNRATMEATLDALAAAAAAA